MTTEIISYSIEPIANYIRWWTYKSYANFFKDFPHIPKIQSYKCTIISIEEWTALLDFLNMNLKLINIKKVPTYAYANPNKHLGEYSLLYNLGVNYLTKNTEYPEQEAILILESILHPFKNTI